MERSTIHLLHKRGKSQREIASELGRSRSAVARPLSEPVDQPSSGRRRKSSVDAFREQIAACFAYRKFFINDLLQDDSHANRAVSNRRT